MLHFRLENARFFIGRSFFDKIIPRLKKRGKILLSRVKILLRELNIGKHDLGVLAFSFLVSLLSKGGVFAGAYAIDDYVHSVPQNNSYGGFFSQGRYVQALVDWLISEFNVVSTDVYVFFGFVALFLCSVLSVSILRFIGLNGRLYSFVLAGLLVSHPYVAEIFTFKMALPAFSFALLFCIVVVESVLKFSIEEKINNRYLYVALFGAMLLVFTYQIFINTIVVVSAVSAFFFYARGRVDEVCCDGYKRAVVLFLIAISSSVLFVFVLKIVSFLFSIEAAGRSKFIGLDQVPLRIEQFLKTLRHIYYDSEPIQSTLTKRLLFAGSFFSMGFVFLKQIRQLRGLASLFVCAVFFLLFAVLSVGVILPFSEWWPVPRVVSHVSIIPVSMVGIAFFLMRSQKVRAAIFVASLFVLFSQILSSNQIFRDQQRLNVWDRMFANRIISRLESMDGFSNVQYVYIQGGRYGYPAPLKTLQGDMNISAFSPSWTKLRLLEEVTGYNFARPSAIQVKVGESYCAKSKPWPHKEAIGIDENLAIICL